jgi:hypothetical protein
MISNFYGGIELPSGESGSVATGCGCHCNCREGVDLTKAEMQCNLDLQCQPNPYFIIAP